MKIDEIGDSDWAELPEILEARVRIEHADRTGEL
jgi:hypothetical protein